MALFDSTITFHAHYQQRHDVPALVDLLVLDRDNPRSLGLGGADACAGASRKLAGSAPGEVPEIALTVPDPAHGRSKHCANAMRKAHTATSEHLLQTCTDAAYHLSDDLGTRYFTHSEARAERRGLNDAA